MTVSMKKYSTLNIKKNSYNPIYLCAILLGITINQTTNILGINSSLSDIVLLILISVLILNKQLYFIKNETIFFLLLSISVLLSATFVVPSLYNITPNILLIFSDYIKLLISFLYLTLGYSLSKLKMDKKVIETQAIFAVFIAILGIITNFISIPIIQESLYFGEYRLKGFLNDPNLFAIVQILAIIYFLKSKKHSNKFSNLSILLLIFSILLSGSKTGLMSLFFIFCFYFIQNNSKHLIKLNTVILLLILTIILIVLVPIIVSPTLDLLNSLTYQNHSIERLSTLFTNFDDAISGNGSARDDVWGKAIIIISMFPITGVGVGTYLSIADKLPGIATVAHNTYLQLYAEWGIIFASIFFLYIFKILFRSLLHVKNNLIVDIVSLGLIAIMIGSISISLNNARLFWLYLGILLYQLKKERGQKNIIANSKNDFL